MCRSGSDVDTIKKVIIMEELNKCELNRCQIAPGDVVHEVPIGTDSYIVICDECYQCRDAWERSL